MKYQNIKGRILRFTSHYLIMTSIFACSKDDVSKCEIPEPGLTEASELIQASNEKITINGTTLILLSDPHIDPYFEVYNLVSSNFLIDVDSTVIPEGIILAEQYVINNDAVWFATYDDTHLEEWDNGPYVIHRISYDGPKWVEYDPAIEGYDRTVKVIVIARVIDTNNCAEYYLRDERFIDTRGG